MLNHWYVAFYLVGGTWIPAFVLSTLLTWLMIRLSPILGLVDKPSTRKNHARVMPMGGGLAIAGATLLWFAGLSLSLWGLQQQPAWQAYLPEFAVVHLPGVISKLDSLWLILGAAAAICVLGLVDDRWGLPWQVRLLLQVAIAVLCVWWQGWRLTAFINIPMLTGAMSVLWIVALINSFNMLDNMDGLSAGVAMIVSISLGTFLLITVEDSNGAPQYFVAGLLWVLAGSLAGFLCFNKSPARIFMGDTGSLFVGFMIAVATLLATFTSYQSSNPYRILAPPMVLAVPFYDMISVILIRVREGRSPFQADRCHLSHRLENMGMSRPMAVVSIYILTSICCLCAISLSVIQGPGSILLLGVVLLVLLLVSLLERTGKRPDDIKRINETSVTPDPSGKINTAG